MADYITEGEGTTYMGERLNADAWTAASSGDRVKAIKMATKIIDHLNYIDDLLVSTQVNQFPRTNQVAVPQDIKDACAEMALALLDGVDPELEHENLYMTQFSFVNAKIVYDRENPAPHIRSGVPSMIAWRLLSPYLRDPQQIIVSRDS